MFGDRPGARLVDEGSEGVEMVPTMTVSAVLSDASGVVSEFDTLMILIGGLSIGFFVVGYLIRKIKTAKR